MRATFDIGAMTTPMLEAHRETLGKHVTDLPEGEQRDIWAELVAMVEAELARRRGEAH